MFTETPEGILGPPPSSVKLTLQLGFVLDTQFSLQKDFEVFHPISPYLPCSERPSVSTAQGGTVDLLLSSGWLAKAPISQPEEISYSMGIVNQIEF